MSEQNQEEIKKPFIDQQGLEIMLRSYIIGLSSYHEVSYATSINALINAYLFFMIQATEKGKILETIEKHHCELVEYVKKQIELKPNAEETKTQEIV